MTRNIPRSRQSTRDESHDSRLQRFWSEQRAGAASQIDFANAMVILLFGIMFFFGASTAMMATTAGSGSGDQLTTWRAADKLVGDEFVENTGDSLVSHDCVDAYFTATDSSGLDGDNCEHDDHENGWYPDGADEQDFLQNSLSLGDGQRAAVHLEQGGNVYVNAEGEEYKVGGDPPENFDVNEYSRRIVMDPSGTGNNLEWFTLTVYVW